MSGALKILPVLAAAVFSAAAAQSVPAVETAAPVEVHGFLPGYTDAGLQFLVRACVAAAPVSGMPDAWAAGWHVQVDVANVWMPRVFTVVRATLIEGDEIVASYWVRTVALDTAPPAVLCGTVWRLTQKLWGPAAARWAV
jgi:hypothetical protein